MGAEVRVIAPPTLLPSGIERMGCTAFTDMREGLKDVDIVMMLRLQTERMQGSFVPSIREYYRTGKTGKGVSLDDFYRLMTKQTGNKLDDLLGDD